MSFSGAATAPPGRRSRLLLLTGNFPHREGDFPFVAPEIGALAGRFDEVVVASFHGPSGPGVPQAELPPNCRYVGPLRPGSLCLSLRGIASLHRMRTMWSALRLGRSSNESHLIADLKACRVGLAIAADPRLQADRGSEAVTTVYSFWGLEAGLAIPWLAAQPSTHALVRLHRFDLYDDVTGYHPLRPALFRAADAILAISDHGRAHLLDRYPPIPADHVLVSRLGVAGPAQVPVNRRVDPFAVVSCSSVTETKAVDRILEVVASLARSGFAIRWTHFGDGPGLEDLRIRAVALTVATPGLEVELAGWRSNDDVLAHYRQAQVDLFVNLSRSEGVPVSLMEAAAWGVPLLATDVGGVAEIVGAELGSGLLVDPTSSTDQIAAQALEILRSATGRFAPRQVWANRFDATATSVRAADLVAGVAASPAAGPNGSWCP
ncbi:MULTISPECIES: glycosyltransferase [unclassified Nocardioides]|uniref:glycosyltransferase n=1 Tax=unclassified Nocardioides TaxID=2615069 RepID=UPI0006FB0EA0|nr:MULTISPECIES: glycosyltransferase [unclassified Nocardioides]KRA37433.1 hypothetical protein ASD81_01510 [Nocardioides sp. Root614]KRA91394.1 hypothetical protein ASD84_01775 [Nocardioides sp. Root682]